MWSGSDVAQPGRNAVEHDGGNDGTAGSSFAGRLVDTVTTAVAKMDVDDRSEPKWPLSLRQISLIAREEWNPTPFSHASQHSLERHSCSAGDESRSHEELDGSSQKNLAS